jgi:hypothetical protein
MLGIARRNLARLTDTVEWSQELATLAEKVPAPELGSVKPGELAQTIPDRLTLDYDPLDETETLFTDPQLVAIVAGQMERVLSVACPGCLPAFALSFDAEGARGLLAARAEMPGERSSLPARTGAGSGDLDPAAWDRAEFRNLARLMVSPTVLQALGAGIRTSATADRFELILELPLLQAAPVPSP